MHPQNPFLKHLPEGDAVMFLPLPECNEEFSVSQKWPSKRVQSKASKKYFLPCTQVDSVISQLYPDTWQPAKSGAWSRYQIATTVRRDNESSSSSIYAAAHPGDRTPDNSKVE